VLYNEQSLTEVPMLLRDYLAGTCPPTLPILKKLAAIVSPRIQEILAKRMEEEQGVPPADPNAAAGADPAAAAGADPAAAVAPPGTVPGAPGAVPPAPPIPGVAPAAAAPVAEEQPAEQSTPTTNPINSYGGLSQSGQLNGNAGLGQKHNIMKTAQELTYLSWSVR
jgi:hypothetical protein